MIIFILLNYNKSNHHITNLGNYLNDDKFRRIPETAVKTSEYFEGGESWPPFNIWRDQGTNTHVIKVLRH